MPPKASKIQEEEEDDHVYVDLQRRHRHQICIDQDGTKSEERVDHDGTKSSPNPLNRISPNRGQSQAQAQQRRGAHDRHESGPKKVMVTRLDSVPL